MSKAGNEKFTWWYERVFCQSPSKCKLQYDDEKMWEAWKAGYNLATIEMQKEVDFLSAEIALWKLSKTHWDIEYTEKHDVIRHARDLLLVVYHGKDVYETEMLKRVADKCNEILGDTNEDN